MPLNNQNNSTLITKPFSDLDEQIRILEKERRLKIKDITFAKKKLLETNYFDLINGFETLLLTDKNDKGLGYENKTFEDFLSLYNFDKELNKETLAVISSFESKLKTSLSYHFCDTFCSNSSDTLNYLLKSNYKDPVGTCSKFSQVYKDYHNNNFILFKNSFGYRHDLNYVDYMKNIKTYVGRYQTPPLWVIIKNFNMGDLLAMVRLLKHSVLKKVLKDFNLTLNDSDLFINSIEIIKDLRNTCAHFELVNRFRTSGSYNINNDLILRLQLNTLSNNRNAKKRKQYRLRLYDVLKVLSLFQDITPIRKVIVRYYDRNISIRKNYLVLPLLERMGETSIVNWKKLGN